jgi:serine/threonine-protein kinase
LGLALFEDDKNDASLTMEYNDKVLGTADYLAPEQAINSHNVDHKADMYGLGCTLYFLLTGHPPFPEGSIASRIIKHQNSMPTDIRKDRPDCPGELDGICVKMLQKDPKFRYGSCDQVADVLEAWIAKYRKEKPDAATSSFSVADVLSNKLTSQRDVDTVSNHREGTMGGKSAIVKLSTSDSGVLRAIAKSDASTIDSNIDLIHDTNAPNRSKSKSQAIARADSPLNSKKPGGSSSPLVSPMAKTNTPKAAPAGNKPVAAGNKPASPTPMTGATAATKKNAQSQTKPTGTSSTKKSSNVVLFVVIAALTVVLFVGIVAVLLNRG